jgi:hypothetical protein
MGYTSINLVKYALTDMVLQANTVNDDNVPFVAIRIPTGCGFVILDGTNTAVFTLTPALNDDDEPVYDQS